MKKLCMVWIIIGVLLEATACVSHSVTRGSETNPMNQLKLGQTYGDMVKLLGLPDHSSSEDRSAEEMAILFLPVWGIVEAVGDFNPSMLQIYTYKKWGTVTVNNNNRIIRIDAKRAGQDKLT